jgi:intraflagellar transport protein 74
MNLALDSSSTGITRQQIQNETIAFREQNELLQNQLEQIFKERQKIEQQNQQLDAAIVDEKAKMNEMIYSLSPEQQNRYREFHSVSENLKSENAEIHEKIETMIKQKERLSSTVISSQARLEAVKLHSKLRETIAKRNQLREEETNRLSPSQEREKLINDVKMNNQAISGISKQMKTVSDQLKDKREQLIQIEQDLDEGSSEKLMKYRELRKRDEMMTNFMETFPFQLTKEKQSKLPILLFMMCI